VSNRDTALSIYCALLSRDPLAQQRFTALGERFEQLAHLAHAAANQFDEVAGVWDSGTARAEEIAAKLWDLRSVSIEPILKQPKNLVSTDDEHKIPKSQGDLLGEMRQ
jgi:hypothetical protein